MARKQPPMMRPLVAPRASARATSSILVAQRKPSNRGLSALFRMTKDEGPCPKCEETLHRKSGPGRDSTEVPPIVYDVLRSPGRPLDPPFRAEMEHRFGGAEFGNVRVHDDSRAEQSVSAVNARAFTVGPHVVVGDECRSPASTTAKAILAHELVHVIQQTAHRESSHVQNSLTIVSPADASEKQAEAISRSSAQSGAQRPGGLSVRVAPQPVQLSRLQHPECLETWNECVDQGWVPSWKCTECFRYCDAQEGQWPSDTCPERRRRLPSWDAVRDAVLALGLSLALVVTVAAALADPEPATKLALIGLTAVQISTLLRLVKHDGSASPQA